MMGRLRFGFGTRERGLFEALVHLKPKGHWESCGMMREWRDSRIDWYGRLWVGKDNGHKNTYVCNFEKGGKERSGTLT